ncbi:MAG: Nitrilase/cyanide hydratase and apolipoprotein N-acyltransferase [Acidobacteriaceae bacterium]|nr:Nitrilase/cyanide hydratase and apolipoprotein N-acyltransferase [Acidobacteriaceae bacterium]
MTSIKNKKIALIQMSCEPDTAANLDKAADRVLDAAKLGANIVCLPELFRVQYFCQREEHSLFDTAESIPGPSTARLGAIAREHNIVIIASLFERRAAGLYHNTAAILDGKLDPATHPDNIAGIYRKMHIPDDPLYYEKFYFTPGDLGFKAMTTTHGRIGTLVCWDQWYPEAARETALRGANTLFYPTAIGWHPSEKAEYGDAQYSAWQTMQRAHAIANGVFVGAVNRVGFEHGDVIHNGVEMKGPEGAGLEFWGGSFIADPFGRVIAQASHDKEEILTAEIDLKLLEDTRRNWPFLRDRRIDAYGGITSRFID